MTRSTLVLLRDPRHRPSAHPPRSRGGGRRPRRARDLRRAARRPRPDRARQHVVGAPRRHGQWWPRRHRALIMEILHPAVMAGVHDLSNYQTQPERRMRNTFGYVVTTCSAAPSGHRAHRAGASHARAGQRTMPDGRPYRAMDPDLIGWVHTAIPWAIMSAYDAYRRPLTVAEKDRYLAEQAVIGRMGGAGDIPDHRRRARRLRRAHAPPARGHRADAVASSSS